MTEIKWLKTYVLKVSYAHFRVHVTEYNGGSFNASCLWHEHKRVLKVPGQPGALWLQLEQRHSTTAQDALRQIEDWAKNKFGEYSLYELMD